MFLAAGEVVAAVTGKPWAEVVRERLLNPLQMNRTRVSVSELVGMDNVASPHKTFPDRSERIDWMNWDSMAAAGGIISSVEDMSHWLRLQLRNGQTAEGTALFSAATAYEMWQPQTIIPISPSRSARNPSNHFRAYGLGWSLSDYEGCKLVGHGGGYDGMYSEVLMVPEKQLGIVVLTNSMTPIGSVVAQTVVDHFVGAPPQNRSAEGWEQFLKSRAEFSQKIEKSTTPVITGTQPSHPLTSYAGTFECPLYGKVEVAVVDGKLQMRLLPYPELVADLEHLHYDTFAIRWHRSFAWFDSGTAHFVANARGEIVQIQLDVPNDDLWFYELNPRRIAP
jgi:hypothetical protein